MILLVDLNIWCCSEMPFLVTHSVALLGLMSITNEKMAGSDYFFRLLEKIQQKLNIFMKIIFHIRSLFVHLPVLDFSFLQSVQIKFCHFSSLKNKECFNLIPPVRNTTWFPLLGRNFLSLYQYLI